MSNEVRDICGMWIINGWDVLKRYLFQVWQRRYGSNIRTVRVCSSSTLPVRTNARLWQIDELRGLTWLSRLWELIQSSLSGNLTCESYYRKVCETIARYCLQHITSSRHEYLRRGRNTMKRISITIRADVSSVFTCSKMSCVSLNKLPFLYCHDEPLTINISRKAQQREQTSLMKEYS